MNRQAIGGWYSWIVTKSLEYSFTAAVWLTWFTDTSWKFSKKTWKGIQDAHTETVWVYNARNSRPWPCKQEPVLIDIVMQFYPEKTEFEVSHTTSHQRHRMDDLIEAILVSKVGRYDMTGFFMDVKWRGSAPTLYEMVYAYFLTQGIPVSQNILKSCKLTVETLEYPRLLVSLNRQRSPAILEPFRSWDIFTVSVPAPLALPAPVPEPASLSIPVPTSALKENKYTISDTFRRIISEGPTTHEGPVGEPAPANEQKLEENLASWAKMSVPKPKDKQNPDVEKPVSENGSTTSWVEIQREVAEGAQPTAPVEA